MAAENSYGDVVVLCYHGISETWPASTSVRPADFEAQLSSFAGNGYRGATLSEALVSPPTEKTLVVTFDDAHASVWEHAWRPMERLGIPGTVYAPTNYVGADRPMAWAGYDSWLDTEHEGELACMSWSQLRELAAAGWEIGSHTCSHPRLSQLAAAEIATELAGSRRICEEQTAQPCRSNAYPYSDYDERVVRAAAEAGDRFAVSVPRDPQPPLPFEWPRLGVYHGEGARRVRLRAWSRRLGPSSAARLLLAATARRGRDGVPEAARGAGSTQAARAESRE
ncbi:MAG: polysaccharide deacetylase family protein [Thermoleophilia bacterium]|nr:polysaccharide deacetylase family protein [Thermoleophilia bacterium]